ncbi:MAG: lectin like domain-containing protein [Eubacteriales bacterium]|nr:lectin like domain-containing protein [Eubacteriales bacterium]
MRRKIWMSWMLSASLIVSGFSVFPAVVSAGETGDILQEKSFHRVMDGQEGDLLHYHYEDAQGNEVLPQTEGQAGTYSRRKATATADIPSVFDPRGTEAETPIRDQTDTGACWAFGALKSLEGNAIAQGLYTVEEADFSENHLVWYTYNHLKDTADPLYGDYVTLYSGWKQASGAEVYTVGGNALFAMFTLANGWGAAAESVAPFGTSESMAAEMEQQEESLRTSSVMRLTSAECYDDASRDAIKQAVLENGAMDVSLYYPANSLDRKLYMYTDEETCSLYNNKYSADDANHCVTIVGWDDDYDTFKKTPEASGAWLIANSYGEEYNADGYFWVSYYDTSLCDYYTYQGTASDTYTTAFQYDGFGWGDGFVSDQYIRLANVFTNEAEKPQQLTATSFYTYADGQSYEVNVYRNLGEDGPSDGEWVGGCTTKGVAEYSGYHTVSLAEPIAVAPGETFSVIVTFYADNGKAYALLEGENDPFSELHHVGNVGQSYVYFAEEDEWYDTAEKKYNNVCVKAFANPITEEAYQAQEETYQPSVPTPTPTLRPTVTTTPAGGDAGASSGTGQNGNTSSTSQGSTAGGSSAAKVTKISSASKVVMGKGEKIKLEVKTKPASLKNTLTYRSSNTKVAKVQKNGTVKAKKTGSAKITIQASSGVKRTVKIRVKKAPKSLKVTAAKTVLKKGNTTKLKVRLSKGSASYQLKYKSMNKKILSVSATGKVKAKKVGTTRIRVKTFNEKKAYIKIKVVS